MLPNEHYELNIAGESTLRATATPYQTYLRPASRIAAGGAIPGVDTTLVVETTRGRLFDMAVNLPPGLDVESVGPPDLVAGWLPVFLLLSCPHLPPSLSSASFFSFPACLPLLHLLLLLLLHP